MVAANRDLNSIKKIIVHCSDANDNDPSADTVDWLYRIHVLKNGWSDIGYHYFINRLGQVKECRPLDKVGAHCAGQNFDSIGICLSGKNHFTERQFQSCWNLIKELGKRFGLSPFDVYPHNQFNKNKTCPNFPLSKIWKFEKET